jgi:hypothetical protein
MTAHGSFGPDKQEILILIERSPYAQLRYATLKLHELYIEFIKQSQGRPNRQTKIAACETRKNSVLASLRFSIEHRMSKQQFRITHGTFQQDFIKMTKCNHTLSCITRSR